jgi:hypothetical protein
VSWAISSIVTESTDAGDLYDGFGAAELTIGIRAYQWGWEYYYPKILDLNYSQINLHPSSVGHTLKYATTEPLNANLNNLWRFYQAKEQEVSLLPAHLFVIHSDKHLLASFASSDLFGVNKLKESSAFQKITKASKAEHLSLVNSLGQPKNANLTYDNLSYTEGDLQKTRTYALKRQQNFLKLQSTNVALKTYFDQKSFNRLVNFKSVNTSTSESEQLFNLKTSTRFSTNPLPEIFYNERNRLVHPSTLPKDSLIDSSQSPKLIDFNYGNYIAFKNLAIQKAFNTTSSFTYPLAKPLNGIFQIKLSPLNSFFNIYSNFRISSANKSYLNSEQTLKQVHGLHNEKQNKGSYLTDYPFSSSPLSSHLRTFRRDSFKELPLL